MIKKINEKDENKITGGVIMRSPWFAKRSESFQIINDDNGEVMLKCPTMKEARRYARQLNQSVEEIDLFEDYEDEEY